jgi:hypothetical protein
MRRVSRHEMLGALPLVTSFAARKRHLGYRRLTPMPGLFWDMELSAHEFHYASTVSEGEADRGFPRVMRLAATLGHAGSDAWQGGGILHACDRPDRLMAMTLESRIRSPMAAHSPKPSQSMAVRPRNGSIFQPGSARSRCPCRSSPPMHGGVCRSGRKSSGSSERAMKYYGASVLPLAVPGTQAAIQLLPFLRPDASEVAIVSPTYGEYEHSFGARAWQVDAGRHAGCRGITRAGIAVLANPNNPDGRETMRDDVFGFVRGTPPPFGDRGRGFRRPAAGPLHDGGRGNGAQSHGDAFLRQVLRSRRIAAGLSFLPSRAARSWRTGSGPGRCRVRRWPLPTMLFRAWIWFRNCATISTRPTSRPARR